MNTITVERDRHIVEGSFDVSATANSIAVLRSPPSGATWSTIPADNPSGPV